MSGIDLQYWAISAVACCIVWVWSFFRAPAAAAFLGLTAAPLRVEPVFEVMPGQSKYYVWLIAGLQLLTLLSILKHLLAKKSVALTPIELITKKEAVFSFCLCLIWLKIGVDCLVFGLNDYRISWLKNSINLVFLPIAIAAAAFVAYPRERVVRDLIKGWFAFSAAYLLPTLLLAYLDGRFFFAAFGGERLITYGHSTVETGIQLLSGLIGAFGALVLLRRRGWSTVLLVGWIAMLGLAIALNGTRQAAIGGVVVVTGLAAYFGRETRVRVLLVLFGCGAAGFLAKGLVTSSSLAERSSWDVVKSDERVEIWTESFGALGDNLLTGTGFRNSGRLEIKKDPQSGATIDIRQDNAHGVFQEALVEHGVLLGGAMILSFVASIFSVFTCRRISSTESFFAICLLGECVAGLLSGSLCSTTAYYFIAIYAPVVGTTRFTRGGLSLVHPNVHRRAMAQKKTYFTNGPDSTK